jgi:CheY-like chemotaxis protein
LNPGKKRKLLVIDDESHIAELIKVSLENEPFEIFQAKNGSEGIKIANQIQPDLILLDVQMPEMDGYEVCSTLKTDEKTKKIPVLILSGQNQSLENGKKMMCKADIFIAKPFSPVKLLSILREYAER